MWFHQLKPENIYEKFKLRVLVLGRSWSLSQRINLNICNALAVKTFILVQALLKQEFVSTFTIYTDQATALIYSTSQLICSRILIYIFCYFLNMNSADDDLLYCQLFFWISDQGF